MKIEIITRVNYSYLMNKTKHDLAIMVLDLCDWLGEFQNKEYETKITKGLKILGKSSTGDYITWTDDYCFTCDIAVKSIDSSHWLHDTLHRHLELIGKANEELRKY